MRIARSALAFLLVAVIVIAFVPVIGQADAASKKTVYVVKSIKIKQNGKTYISKISYNKDGLITKAVHPSEDAIMTYTYGKNGEIRSYEEKVTSGKLKGFVGKKTYNWKDGKMVKLTGTISEPGSSGDDSFDTKFTYKGKKVVKSHSTERYFNEKGEPESYDQDIRYTYKDGKVVKAEGMITTTYKYDKKGNLNDMKITFKNKDGKIETPGYYKARISYKNNRAHTLKTENKNGMMDKPIKNTQTYSYKKIKVSKSLADKIAAQQWTLVNTVVIDGIPW